MVKMGGHCPLNSYVIFEDPEKSERDIRVVTKFVLYQKFGSDIRWLSDEEIKRKYCEDVCPNVLC